MKNIAFEFLKLVKCRACHPKINKTVSPLQLLGKNLKNYCLWSGKLMECFKRISKLVKLV